MFYMTTNWNDDDKSFALAEVALPANVIKTKDNETAFARAFRGEIEYRILSNEYSKLTKIDKAKNPTEYDEQAEFIALYQKYSVDRVELSETDEIFMRNCVNALLGWEKPQKGYRTVIAGHEPVEKALAPYIDARHKDKGTMPAFKPLKDALNEFCNDRLATTNESGIFKNFHVKWNDDMTMELINTIADNIKWNKSGIVTASMSFSKIARHILLIALKHTFKWNPVAKKTDRTVIAYAI